MQKFFVMLALAVLSANASFAQTQPSPQPAPRQTIQTAPNVTNLSGYGVRIQPDGRLIVVMAALEAAGFDTKSRDISPFRQELRKDLETLDPDLRRRMREFFVRGNRGLENASPTDQAARYVSLAYALSPAPELAAPARSTELPGGLLEVLDFAPLVREFYRKADFDAKLPEYVRKHQAFGDGLRPNVGRAIGDVTAYLNTRPQLSYFEQVRTTNENLTAKSGKKPTLEKVEARERIRNFHVVPDLLAVPNSAKLRVVGDNYYAVIGSNVIPEESVELRRAYLQFLVDPLIYKNAKEILTHRDAIRAMLDELTQKYEADFNALKRAGKVPESAAFQTPISPDPFLAVGRSLVVASEVRERKRKRIELLTLEARARAAAKQTATNDEVVVVNNRLTFPKADAEAFADLSEAYEAGAVLAFFFDEQLGGLESAGFDVTGSFADMIVSFDAAKETARLKETKTRRATALAELTARRAAAAQQAVQIITTIDPRSLALAQELNAVDNLLKANDFETADKRLMELLAKNPGEPRILFVLGRSAAASARGVFDEELQQQRLDKAAAHFQTALAVSNSETPAALRSNAHVALAKILEFYDRNEEAVKHYDAAIALGKVADGAHAEAVDRREKLLKKMTASNPKI